MDWIALTTALAALAFVLAVLLHRRRALLQTAAHFDELSLARERGSDRARLQHPKVDLAQCIGCGACVRACPEDGVLALTLGQAVVVHGARCVGHGLCAAACPTNAIALTLGDLKDRKDLPAIDAAHEAIGVPGLFLAGEITGFALVRTAVGHGALVARTVLQRRAGLKSGAGGDDDFDLLVIGLGPAGLACLLAAKEHGLRALGVDQAAEVGGTVAAYPRKKLVMTQPMDLPLHGRLGRLEYTKEELVELWQGLARQHALAVRTGQVVTRIEREPGGGFVVVTNGESLRARNVCLAVGRRGSPQRLGVPGEDLQKVAYSLLDAESYQDRAILVVGGGDSAIEAALALAEQPGNRVTISYRKQAFSRLKARNEQRLAEMVATGGLEVRYGTVVGSITEHAVHLRTVAGEGGAAAGAAVGVLVATDELPNDEVFIFAGGTPPFPLLQAAGVSFDPSLRPPEIATDRGTGLLVALSLTGLGLAALLVHRQLHADYYGLPLALRAGEVLHGMLRPAGAVGLSAGIGAVLLFAANLAYLLRRAPRLGRWLPGSLQAWMNAHVATGLGACLFAVLHSGFTLRDSAGGHALAAMVVVVVAGVVGRWFYAFVPRAQNGRQQDLEELATRVTAIAGEWDRQGRGFGAGVRRRIEAMVEAVRPGRGFFARLVGVLRAQWRLRAQLRGLRDEGRRGSVLPTEVERLIELARRSHRLALQLAHFDEVRGLMATWRWLHRWLALLLTVLLVVHVVAAVRFGGLFGGGG